MLTIAIPIYNQDVSSLVQELSNQCLSEKIEHEILCFDDNSESKYREINQDLKSISFVHYKELKQNIGRSKIRNLMAKEASHESILFLDSDSKIIYPTFIKKYLLYLEHDIVSGGRAYPSDKPNDPEKILHWKYGTKNESLSVRKRNSSPYIYFHSNNFLIKKAVIKQVVFDEKISGYGYEDLLFAKAISSQNIPIHHIDNQIEHTGLRTTAEFMNHIYTATKNLASFYIKGNAPNTTLIKYYERVSSIKATGLVSLIWTMASKIALTNLKSNKPSIKILNFWKLYEFIRAIKELRKE